MGPSGKGNRSVVSKPQRFTLLSACTFSMDGRPAQACASASRIKCTKAFFSPTTDSFGYQGCRRKLLLCPFGAPLTPPARLALGVPLRVYFLVPTGTFSLQPSPAPLHLRSLHLLSFQRDQMHPADLYSRRSERTSGKIPTKEAPCGN